MAFDGIPDKVVLEFVLGDDWYKDFVIFTSTSEETVRDVTGYTTEFMVKRLLTDADDDALITASGTISGVFNSSPSVNTQKISIFVPDTDTDTEIEPGVAHWELKRMNADAEKQLVMGKINLRRGVHIA